MARFLKSRLKAKGAAPGSFIFMGKQKMDAVQIGLFQFNTDQSLEKEFSKIDDALSKISNDRINWLNIYGLHDISTIKAIGKKFNISPLAFENVLDTGLRSKFFEDKNSITIVGKAIEFDIETNKISIEQISFILCENTVISFQEKKGGYFESVRERIRNNAGYVRASGADYLLYVLMDCVVDHNLIIAEQIGDRIEQIEMRLQNPDKELSSDIFHYKTEITYFKKTVRPLKEIMTRFLRTNSYLINKETLIYYQELYDLIVHAEEAIDNYYTMIGDHLSIYNTNMSNRANDVMKVLTIFASIFIPLTFVAGIYGTNFEYIPELSFKYGYFGMWGVMILMTLVMLYYFKKNKWF